MFSQLTIVEYPCPHGFFVQGDDSDCSDQALQDLIDFLNQYI